MFRSVRRLPAVRIHRWAYMYLAFCPYKSVITPEVEGICTVKVLLLETTSHPKSNMEMAWLPLLESYTMAPRAVMVELGQVGLVKVRNTAYPDVLTEAPDRVAPPAVYPAPETSP